MCNSIEKSKDSKKIPQLKSSSKYKDAPRFPMIYDYEGEMKENYSKQVKVMTTELASEMIKFTKDEG
jgi:hypothetical protein